MTLSTRKPTTRAQSQSSKDALAENEPGGFAAGTLVHTKESLVPIEKIKVGDWVLTEPMGIQAGQKVRQDRSMKSKARGPAMGTSPIMKM